MISERRIISLLTRLRDEGNNKAGRLRDTLLISSDAVQSVTESHRGVVHQAMMYLSAKRISRYNLSRQEIHNRRKLYSAGHNHGVKDTATFLIDASLRNDIDWQRGYKAGLRFKKEAA